MAVSGGKGLSVLPLALEYADFGVSFRVQSKGMCIDMALWVQAPPNSSLLP